MCLSIPGKIIEISGDLAKVDIAGTIYSAGTQLTENLKVNDLVLIHSGFVIQKLSREEAKESERLLREILNSEDKLK